jgi:hypothetical protein
MNATYGTIQDGKIIPDMPVELPNGTRVTIQPAGTEYVGVGIREEDWPTTPEGIAALVAKMDQIQPFLTPEEEAAWHQALAEQKAWEIANWDKRNKQIDELFK